MGTPQTQTKVPCASKDRPPKSSPFHQIILAFILFVLSLGSIAAAPPSEKNYLMGTCAHFAFRRGDLEYNLAMMKQAGFNSIRDEINWGAVERKKGVYQLDQELEKIIDTAIQKGLTPLIILCYGNGLYDQGDFPVSDEAKEAFARYCEFVVGKLKGRVKYYEFWNEWDYGTGMKGKPGSAEAYANLLKHTYKRIKQIDPEAQVVAGAASDGGIFNGWMEDLLKAGATNYCDGFSIHPYTYKSGPIEQRGAEFFAELTTRFNAMVKKHNNGQEKPLYITELGFPSSVSAKGISEDSAASNMAKSYLLSKTIPSIQGIWQYDFQNDGWNSRSAEDNFGTTYADLTPKRTYFAVKDISAIIRQAKYCGRINVGDPRVWILRFEIPGEAPKTIWVAWSAHQGYLAQLRLRNADSQPTPLTARMCGYTPVVRHWGSRNWIKGEGRRADCLELSLDNYPWIIEGDLSKVSVTGVKHRPFAKGSAIQETVLPKTICAIPKGRNQPKTITLAADNWESTHEDSRWTGVQASIQLSWDTTEIDMDVIVKDETFHIEPNVYHAWKGDSLQLGMFHCQNRRIMRDSWTETMIQVAPEGPKLLRVNMVDNSKTGFVQSMDAGSKREKNTTYYRFRITPTLAGRSAFKSGDIVGLSLVVNDNDGAARKGYLHWGRGIGRSKDMAEYIWLVLE